MLWIRAWRPSIATDKIPLGDGLVATVERRAVKRINIYIRPPFGEVFVTCPKRVNKAELLEVLREKEHWIRRAQARVQAKHRHATAVDDALTSSEGLDGLSILYLGKRWHVSVEAGPKLGYAVDGAADTITFRIPEAILEAAEPRRAADAQAALLKRLYKETLQEALPASLAKWEAKLGVKAAQITFREMRSRWGSCQTRTKRLSFNTNLAKYDLKYFDSVVLHELVHLRVPNHGPDFYRLMDQNLPEWQLLRREMKALPH